MSEKFFRLCPNCNKFFYDREKFLNHGCMIGAEPELASDGYPEDDDGEEVLEESEESLPEAESRRTVKQNSQRAEREKMVDFLRKHGVDMRKERSFRKIKMEYEKMKGGSEK